MRRFFYDMPGMLRTAAAFLLIFSCMVSASAASVRAEERMESMAAQKAEGTTAETMAGTAGGANEQVRQEGIENTVGTRNQFDIGEGQKEAPGAAEEGEGSGSLPNPPINSGGGEKSDPKAADGEEAGRETDQKREADQKEGAGQKEEEGQNRKKTKRRLRKLRIPPGFRRGGK